MEKIASVKRAFVALLGCVVLMAALAGCSPVQQEGTGADQAPGTEKAAAVPQASIADKVKKEGIVRIGIAKGNPPMNYIDDDGNWTGFDVDLASALADELGVKVELVEVDDDTRISYLVNGTIDMSIANLEHTVDHDAQIDFAEPSYIWDGKVVLARKGEFRKLTDLAGKRIAVDEGSSAYRAIESTIADAGLEAPQIETFQGSAACLQALRDGRVDAFAQDSLICAGVVGSGFPDLESVGGFFSSSLYGIGVPSNDSTWRDEVSFGLQNLMKNGVYDEIYDKWFGEDGKFPLPYDVRPLFNADNFGEGQLYIWPE